MASKSNFFQYTVMPIAAGFESSLSSWKLTATYIQQLCNHACKFYWPID